MIQLLELDKLLNTLFDQLGPKDVVLSFEEIADLLRVIFDQAFPNVTSQTIAYTALKELIEKEVQDGTED